MDEITLAPERLNALLERFYTNGYQAAAGELRERVAELESQVRAQDEAWTVWRQLEGRCDAHDLKFRDLFATMAQAAGVRPPRHLQLVPSAAGEVSSSG